MQPIQERTKMTSPEELGFAGCVAEINAILGELETDRIDVDTLTSKVTRATELIEWCKGRLSKTQIQVEEVLERLEPEVPE